MDDKITTKLKKALQGDSSSSRSVLFTSFVRTITPALAGGGLGHLMAAALTWLGFADVDQGFIERVFEYLFFGAYYLAARYLETHKNARWGWLLGQAKAPVYADGPPPEIGPGAGPGDTDVAVVAVPVIEEEGEPVAVAPLLAAPVETPAKKAPAKPVKKATKKAAPKRRT